LARGQERLESARRDVIEAGGQALVFPADVADREAIAHAAEHIVDEWGRLDVWVNNAMATVFGPADGISPEEFKRVSEVTYLGQVYGTLAALKHMRAQGGGTIVQVGSALAYRSIPLQSAYCAAKAAVRGFTDSLRSELIHERSPIRLTMVHLPAVNTPQFDWARNLLPLRPQPVPPIHEPAVAAEAIFRAAREAPRELWVGRPTVQAILGTMAAPGLLDRMMARRAWDGQMTTEPSSRRPDNLFQPVAGDWGTAGRFTDVSKGRVVTISASAARGFAAATALGLLAGVAALASRRWRRHVGDQRDQAVGASSASLPVEWRRKS
jgi:NAD(P)-dependent dehydrogenase (short-subunit alcohol dehydrogenase family)